MIYKVEFLIKASTPEAAKRIVKELSMHELSGTSVAHGEGHFLISEDFSEDELSDSFYSKVRISNNVAIFSDGSQKKRREAILEKVEEVEHGLRKLLLYVNGSIEDYFDLFRAERIAKHTKRRTIVMTNEMSPLTSLLTFEEIIGILETDISWLNYEVKGPNEILKLIDGVDDLNGLRKKLEAKMAPKKVWDVISENSLSRQYTWEQLAGNIKELKRLRNRAAHFQILNSKDVKKAERLNREIVAKIGEQNRPNNIQPIDRHLIDFGRLVGDIMKAQNEQLMNIAHPQIAIMKQIASSYSWSQQVLDTINAQSKLTTINAQSKLTTICDSETRAQSKY